MAATSQAAAASALRADASIGIDAPTLRDDAMSKGAQTRQVILEQALDLSSEVGLEGLSIGVLAKIARMSKSGLYAHFESKEDLQVQVLDAAAQRFIDQVMSPALKQPRGLPRLEALFEGWRHWETEGLRGGCLFISAAAEFDDRPGAVRERLVGHLRDMLGGVARAAQIAVEEGHLRADVDPHQLAYELWGVLLAHHATVRLLGRHDAPERVNTAFRNIIDRARA